MYSRNCSKEL
jgi:NADH-ubiquinone oxidoreductase chain 4